MKNNFVFYLLVFALILTSFSTCIMAEETEDIRTKVVAPLDKYVITRPTPQVLADIVNQKVDTDPTGIPVVRIEHFLPNILLNSPAAATANQEITDLEERIVNRYLSAVEDSSPEDLGLDFHISAYYNAYVNEDILSIYVNVTDYFGEELFGLDAEVFGHYIYNFDLSTGERLNDDALISFLGGEPDQMDFYWEHNIARESRKYGDLTENSIIMENYLTSRENIDHFSSHIGLSDQITASTLEFFRTGEYGPKDNAFVNPEASRLYFDNSGNLMMVYAQNTNPHWFVVDAPYIIPAIPENRPLNPIYGYLMQALGENPENSPYRGLIAFLGPAGDEEYLAQVLYKVTALANKIRTVDLPSALFSNMASAETNWQIVGTFSEFYLLIPKYKDDYVKMVSIGLTDDGELVETEYYDGELSWSYDMQPAYALDYAIIGLSTETMPTAGLHISNIYENDEVWYPNFSGKDGSLILPDEILDVTDQINTIREEYSATELWVPEDYLKLIKSYYGH